MRDPMRLYSFYERLRAYHVGYFPDWRFGQLITNLEAWLSSHKGFSDMFYVEEDEMLRYMEEFVEDYRRKR